MTMLVTWIFRLRPVVVFALVLVLVPATADAQRGGGGSKGSFDRSMRRQDRRDAKRDIRRDMKSQHERGGGGRGDMPGRGAVIGRALGLLTLTPEQRNSLRQIRERSDERMRQHGRRVLDLRRQIESDLFGPEYRPDDARGRGRELAATVGARTSDRTLLELTVFETLTPSQRAELRAAREAQKARMREAVRERMDRRGDGQGSAGRTPGTVEPDPVPGERPGSGGERGGPPGGAGGTPELLAGLNVTSEQLARMRQLRRQHAPAARQAAMRFRDLQARIDDLLVADAIDSALVRTLASELGAADTERELLRFESEAGMRDILTPEQAAAFRDRRRRQWHGWRDDSPAEGDRKPQLHSRP